MSLGAWVGPFLPSACCLQPAADDNGRIKPGAGKNSGY